MKIDISLMNDAYKLLGLICLFIITLSSCAADNEGSPLSALGNPTSLYILDGKVVSESDTGKGIPGIRVEITIEKKQLAVDTLYTGSDGGFKWESPISAFDESVSFTVAATDTSGIYESASRTVLFEISELKKDGVLFYSEIKKSIAIALKEKVRN